MASTYTTQWFGVQHGDITSHNPQTLAPTNDPITLSNAQIQWEGVEGTTEESRNTENYTDWTSVTSLSSEKTYTFSTTIPSNYPGDANSFWVETNIEEGGGGDRSYDISFKHQGETFATQSHTAGGYDVHNLGEEIPSRRNPAGGDAVSVEIVVTPADGVTITETEMRGSSRVFSYEEVPADTKDPRVTRDVSGDSAGITLTDGEQSNWFTLSALEPNDEQFYHDIDGGQKARFRIRFDYEEIHPSKAHGMVGFYDESADVFRECIVADPTDSQLQYNHIATYNPDTASWGVLDVVDVSNEYAIESYAFYDPDVGWVAPREYTTTQP